MREARVTHRPKDEPADRELGFDQSRVEMMRSEKRLTVEERVALFESMSRAAAWARPAKRIR